MKIQYIAAGIAAMTLAAAALGKDKEGAEAGPEPTSGGLSVIQIIEDWQGSKDLTQLKRAMVFTGAVFVIRLI